MLMCAYPGLSFKDAMEMSYHNRNIFIDAYNKFHK